MAASGVPDFPMPVRMVYQPDGTARTQFLTQVSQMAADAKKQFQSAFAEIDATFKRTAGSFNSGQFKLDFDLSSMRQAAADADFTARRLVELKGAVERANQASGASPRYSQQFVQALRAQVAAAFDAKDAADQQVGAYSRLQSEIDRTAAANTRLAQSYRETFAEQARAANLASNSQRFFNNATAPGLDPFNAASRNGATFSALANVGKYDDLRRAEVGAAEGARLVEAAHKETALALDRSTKSAQQSAQAFNVLFQAMDARSERAAQNFFNTALGVDQTAKSARESARAFEELFAAQDRAAAAQDELASSAARLRSQLDPSIALQQRYDAELANADRLLQAGAISAREYGQAQALARSNLQQSWQALTRQTAAVEDSNQALRRGTTAHQNVINSTRASRTAFVQLGQQMQDVVVQTQLGTSAFIVFSQQVPQAAFALSGLEGNANKVYDRVGKVATFLAGPWGAAIFAATAILGPYIAELFRTKDALDEMGDAADQAMKKLYQSLNQASAFSDSFTESAKKRIEAMGDLARVNRQITQGERNVEALAGTVGGAQGLEAANNRLAALYKQRKTYTENLKDAEKELDEIRQAVKTKAIQDKNQDLLNASPDKPKKTTTRTDRSAAREAERLATFGDRAAESIQRINERFDEQPRLIDQTNRATRELDDIIADLEKRQPPGFQQMITEAEQAKEVVADALTRPLRLLEQESQRSANLRSLVLSGYDKEAAILDEIYRQQDLIGDLTEDHVDDIVRIVSAREQQLEVDERLAEVQGYYLDATRSVRSEVEAILAGQGKLSNLKQVAQRLQGQVLADQLFGDVFDELDDWVKEKTGIGSSVEKLGDEVDRSGDIVRQFADVILGQTRRIEGGIGGTGVSGGVQDSIGSIIAGAGAASVLATAAGLPANDNPKSGVDPVTGEIVVVREKNAPKTIQDLTPNEYWNELTKRLGEGLTSSLDSLFRTNGLFGSLSGPIAGGLQGYITGGAPGGIIGLLKGIDGLPEGIADALGKAGRGAATGTAVAGVAGAFGINLSNTGSQIGGAIGSALPIPGGDIIGAIAGGIIGKLFGGTKRGSATIGGSGSVLDITGTRGNSSSYINAASAGADNIISAVERIADAFGATIDASLGSVSIGVRKGKYRVDESGSGITKTSRGAVDFGKDGAAAAIQYATLDLIRDGVIKGLREGTQRLLQQAKDLDSGLQKAIDFEGVFAQLKEIKDPVGAALDALDKEFTRLQSIFDEAGASAEEYASLEELYSLKRADAIKQAQQQISGSLQDLLDSLTIGDSGLSLRARQANAYEQYAPLRDRVQAGDVSAYDDFARSAQTLLDIQRELYGSQSEYFDLFNEVKGTTQTALDATTAIAEASANRDNPFTGGSANDNASVVDAIDAQTQAIVDSLTAQFGAANVNLGALIAAVKAGNTNLAAAVGYSGTF